MRREKYYQSSTQIRVVGVGCAGSSAVDSMISADLQGLAFMVVNTDAASLDQSRARIKLQIGEELTRGLGSRGNPAIGAKAAYRDSQEIKNILAGANVLFIAAGLGGGTGSGAAPVIAGLAREMGILTIAVLTQPFRQEGSGPNQIAKESINAMEKYVDYLVVFPNDRYQSLVNEPAGRTGADGIVESLICQGVRVINEFVNFPGIINIDLANLRSIMSKRGATLITVGRSRGPHRAREAAERALVCPILGLSVHGARGMLINVVASSSLDLQEIQTISNLLKNTTNFSAEVVLGVIVDESMGDEMRITVVATGFSNDIWDTWTSYETGRQPLPEEEAVPVSSLSSLATSLI